MDAVDANPRRPRTGYIDGYRNCDSGCERAGCLDCYDLSGLAARKGGGDVRDYWAKRMDQLRENLATVEFVISVDEAVGLNERARVATISTPTKILPQEGSVGKREQLFLAVRIPPLMHAEFDTLFWPKRYPCVDLGRSRGSQREPKATQYRGQTKDSFSHGRCTHENRFRTANT
jgi:hypothetical protein